jgi:hypothetical protein
VAQVDTVKAFHAVMWAVMHSENSRIAFSEGQNFRPRLHTRTLLSQDEFTTSIINARFGEQEHHL